MLKRQVLKKTMYNDHVNLKGFLQLAGPILYFALQFSCFSIAIDIQKFKSVRKLSSIPFVSLFVNGFYWTEYGLFIKDFAVWFPNLVSIFVALFCMYIYYHYSIIKPFKIYFISLLLIIVGLILGLCKNLSIIGLIACILSIIVSGSPLAVIKTVIIEKSTISLPFLTSFISWLNAITWVLYSEYVIKDYLILIPNLIGLILTTIQMLLFFMYGISSSSSSNNNNMKEGKVTNIRLIDV